MAAPTATSHRITDADPETGLATCSICGPNTEVKREKTWWRCRTAIRVYRRNYNRIYQQRHGTRWRNDRRTREEKVACAAEQGGRCAICGKEVPLQGDHDHSTGKPRGMLCVHCNLMLGYARDNPDVLLAAIRYLKRWSEPN